jgi:hypothetical protein
MNDDAIRISFKIFNCLYKLQHAVSFIIIKYADFVKMSFFDVCNFWFHPLCDSITKSDCSIANVFVIGIKECQMFKS